MKHLNKGMKVIFNNKKYFLHAIVDMVAVNDKLKARGFKDVADYPTDHLTFVEDDIEFMRGTRFNGSLFEINRKIKKKILEIVENGK